MTKPQQLNASEKATLTRILKKARAFKAFYKESGKSPTRDPVLPKRRKRRTTSAPSIGLRVS